MLREVLPGAFVLVFLLCMTSFAVALTLGGGPRATTRRARHLPGGALRLRPRPRRLAGADPVRALRRAWRSLALRLSAEAGFGGGLAGQRAALGRRPPGPARPRRRGALALLVALPRPAARRDRRARPAGPRRRPARRGLARGAAQPRGGARLGGAGAARSASASPRSSTPGGRGAAGGGSRRPAC